MSEEISRKLEEAKKQKEKAYTIIKGMIKGVRLGKLGQKNPFLSIIETMFDGFNNIWKEIFFSLELQLQTTQRFDNLETQVSRLEKDMLQFRQTLDKMVQDK